MLNKNDFDFYFFGIERYHNKKYKRVNKYLFSEIEKKIELQGIITNQIEIIVNNNTKITEQNNSLKLLIEKVENSETEVINLSKLKIEQTNTISTIIKEFDEQKVVISKLNNKVQLKKSEINQIANRNKELNKLLRQEKEMFIKTKENQTKENEKLVIEINRLNKLKWYDKMFGKK